MVNSDEKSLRERKEEKNRLDILEAAEKLFNQLGINNISVQDIAEEVMLSRATLYNYFGTKDNIMYVLAAQRLREGNLRLEELAKSPLESYTKLMKYIEVSFDATLASPARLAILRQFLITDNTRKQAIEDKYKDHYDKKTSEFVDVDEIPADDLVQLQFLEQIWIYETRLYNIIENCQSEQMITSEFMPMELVYFIILSLNGIADQMGLHTTPLEKYNIEINSIKKIYLDTIQTLLRQGNNER